MYKSSWGWTHWCSKHVEDTIIKLKHKCKKTVHFVGSYVTMHGSENIKYAFCDDAQFEVRRTLQNVILSRPFLSFPFMNINWIDITIVFPIHINILTKACGLQQESHFKLVWSQDNAGSGPNQQQTLPEDDIGPQLARYLNRSYWEQRQSEETQQHEKQIPHISDRNGGRVGSPLGQQPSAPMSSSATSNKIVSGNTSIVLNVVN